MSSQSPNNGNSSSGCGTFIGIVFVALIIFGVWYNVNGHQPPPPNGTPIINEQTPVSTPAPNPTVTISADSPTVPPDSQINPSSICNAYYSILDPNYGTRCSDATNYVETNIFPQGQYHETLAEIEAFNAYYKYQAEMEDQHRLEANQACEFLNQLAPDYTQQCDALQKADWEPLTAWPYTSTN